MRTLFVVPHTHWDREWYEPAERFRQRLIPLVDELLDDPLPDLSFLLDGQAVAIEDYLAVRPERAADVSAALRDRRIEAGPWFVLADELIPSGEALVRNLLAGRRVLRALRADAPPVLYCPDSFGHPAALPVLAAGFGLPVAVAWRGIGGDATPPGDTFTWSFGDAQVTLYHLPRSGYELGANLPADATAATRRWQEIRAQFGGRATASVALLLNGADHHARQRDLPAALAALRETAASDGYDVRAGSLREFAEALAERVAARHDLPRIEGEQRDSSGFTWSLQGTLASRTRQKRRYRQVEHALVRDAEPWCALAWLARGDGRRALVHAAWRDLLLCQPHDTLCGCSVDQVARAMDARLDAAATQVDGLRTDALLDLLGHDREAARQAPQDWTASLVIRNAAPRPRGGVARVSLTMKLADVPVGPGSAHVSVSRPGRAEYSAVHWPVGEPVQILDVALGHERTESPRHYPDNDAVARFDAMVWVARVEPYGIACMAQPASRLADVDVPNAVQLNGRSLTNGHLTLRWDRTGRFTLEDSSGRRIRSLIDWESRRDLGDLYTPSVRGRKFTPRLVTTRVLHDGPLRGVVEQRWRMLGKGGGAVQRVDLAVQLALDADARFLRIHVRGENAARDHRLRLRVRTDVSDALCVADAAFGPVARPGPAGSPTHDMEQRLPTAPLHRYVSLYNDTRGATLYGDGLTEYEAAGDGVAVTLLRCVGELSRSDLPERPGHAGWPAAVPGAQEQGAFSAELALLLHGPRDDATLDLVERTADDVLLPLRGETLRSALRLPPRVGGVALEGEGLAHPAIRESEDAQWLVLRCANILDRPVTGAWRLPAIAREAHVARLDETIVEAIEVRGDTIPIAVPARGVLTVLAR